MKLADFYDNHSKCSCKDYIFVDSVSASLIKYSINSFLATKVTFFNQLHEIFESSEVNSSWRDLINALSKDNKIGATHMDVPGHDGRKGYGGACFERYKRFL